jgi:hypothetical protein
MWLIEGDRTHGVTGRASRVTSGAAAALLGVVLLAGCSGGPAKSTSAQVTPAPRASGVTSTSPSPAASTTASPSATATSAGARPPKGGDIKQTIAPSVVPTKRAVPLDKVSPVTGNVAVSLGGVKGLTVKALGPGEIAGPALAVTVRIKNDSGHPLDVSSAYVTLVDSDGNVGSPTTSAPAKPFVGSIPSGVTAEGIYVFTVAKSSRNPVNVVVSYSAKAPSARFVGNAA